MTISAFIASLFHLQVFIPVLDDSVAHGCCDYRFICFICAAIAEHKYKVRQYVSNWTNGVVGGSIPITIYDVSRVCLFAY